jgi:hypothetical protein
VHRLHQRPADRPGPRTIALAQINAASSQRWRQWSESTTRLFTSAPHHAASSASELIPCRSTRLQRVARGKDQRPTDQRQQHGEPGDPLLGQHAHVERVSRDRYEHVELARADAERVLERQVEARPLGAEALDVVGLVVGPLVEEVSGAGGLDEHHDGGRGEDPGRGKAHRAGGATPAARTEHREHPQGDGEGQHLAGVACASEEHIRQDEREHEAEPIRQKQHPGDQEAASLRCRRPAAKLEDRKCPLVRVREQRAQVGGAGERPGGERERRRLAVAYAPQVPVAPHGLRVPGSQGVVLDEVVLDGPCQRLHPQALRPGKLRQ